VHTELLDALRRYLGAKLRIPPAALAFRDVRGPLSEKGVDQGVLTEIEALFRECEEGTYAGGSARADAAKLLQRATKLLQRATKAAKNLERWL
jgi:hypothetical protein